MPQRVTDIFAGRDTTFSFEFFPPKTEKGAESLYAAITELGELGPDFVSVTYGAGGSTRDLTQKLVERILTTTQVAVVPHLTCVCHGEPEIRDILDRYAELGVRNILALGGDPPRDKPDYDRGQDAFRYAADLVTYVKQYQHPSEPRGFAVGVAGFPEGHPATPNRFHEVDHLKAKVDAGADYLCTQLFFDNRDFFDWQTRCQLAGIDKPMIAGVMPITSYKGMQRMADLAAGARVPAGLLEQVLACGEDNDEAVAEVGIAWCIEQCRELIDRGVAGIHFYTLNKSDATRRVFDALGVSATR